MTVSKMEIVVKKSTAYNKQFGKSGTDICANFQHSASATFAKLPSVIANAKTPLRHQALGD